MLVAGTSLDLAHWDPIDRRQIGLDQHDAAQSEIVATGKRCGFKGD
jgi:hypothetical protein